VDVCEFRFPTVEEFHEYLIDRFRDLNEKEPNEEEIEILLTLAREMFR